MLLFPCLLQWTAQCTGWATHQAMAEVFVGHKIETPYTELILIYYSYVQRS